MTNEDKLKIMNHNELATFLKKIGGCPVKWQVQGCYCVSDQDAIIEGDYCFNCWSDWLKEEVEEDGNQ